MFTIDLVFDMEHDDYSTFQAATLEEANSLFDVTVKKVGTCYESATITLTDPSGHVIRDYDKSWGYAVPSLADWRAENPAPSCSTNLSNLLRKAGVLDPISYDWVPAEA